MNDNRSSIELQVAMPVIWTTIIIACSLVASFLISRQGLPEPNRDRLALSYGALLTATGGLLLIMLRSVTTRVRSIVIEDEQVRFLAFHDTLSRLPNRTLFEARLKAHLAKARWTSKPFALLLMDLNRFKSINDSHGHQSGDFVLKKVADRVQEVIRSTDVAARLGGDEFGVILPGRFSEISLCSTLAKMIRAIEEPIVLPNGIQVEVGVSIGAVIAGLDRSSPDSLMHRADLALYDAKARGRSCFVLSPTGKARGYETPRSIRVQAVDVLCTESKNLWRAGATR